MHIQRLNPDGNTDALTGADIPVSGTDATKIAAALADKQATITNDNAEAIRGLLELGNTAGMTLKYGGVTMTAAAGAIEGQDVTFTSPFAERVYSVMLTMGGGNPRDNTASISGSSVTGFKCWFGNSGTAERTTTIYYLALGK